MLSTAKAQRHTAPGVTLRGHEKLGGTGVQKSEEKEGNKRRKKGKENIRDA